jgi:hypothetical protein
VAIYQSWAGSLAQHVGNDANWVFTSKIFYHSGCAEHHAGLNKGAAGLFML